MCLLCRKNIPAAQPARPSHNISFNWVKAPYRKYFIIWLLKKPKYKHLWAVSNSFCNAKTKWRKTCINSLTSYFSLYSNYIRYLIFLALQTLFLSRKRWTHCQNKPSWTITRAWELSPTKLQIQCSPTKCHESESILRLLLKNYSMMLFFMSI